MSAEYTTLPARIHLQIREGVLNTLSEFELRARSSTPEPDGTITHDAALIDIIEGTAIALRQKIRKYRDADGESVEDRESVEEYFGLLREWIFASDEQVQS